MYCKKPQIQARAGDKVWFWVQKSSKTMYSGYFLPAQQTISLFGRGVDKLECGVAQVGCGIAKLEFRRISVRVRHISG
jgi:hypothetical protein